MNNEVIKYADDPKRDKKVVKTCEVCKSKYYPRKNGYQTTSRFCGQVCSKAGRSLRFY